MGTPGIALLGPLAVRGDTAGLSPRDRVVLAALAIHPGEVVSAAALAEALWQDSPPASWKKVVQGCVLRLRQVLGTQAIETVQDGYRLTTAVEETDAQRFQRLLDRGRHLLAVGQPERAQFTLDEALGLWRGKPLTDLDCSEAGRIEAARLTELNLEAQECRLRAALEAGRHEEVLAAAEAAVARAPLREQRWALLARAQYRAGRQADALRTLRRARTVLHTELGLDPGLELVELERSILQQDPGLSAAPFTGDAEATCPYPGLLAYDVTDAELFFGRENDIANCLRRLETAGVLAVVGPSGSGKSSLLRAGVTAALVRAGRRPTVVTPGSRPTTLLTGNPDPAGVFVVDQFEELFTLCTDEQERAQFLSGLAAEAADSMVVISLRADRFGAVAGYSELARLVERGLYVLGPMTRDDLRAAITGPAQASGLLLEPGLVDLLVRDVEGQPGALPMLSHALRRTWEQREGRTMTIAGYQATGGIEGCVAQSAEHLYAALTTRQRPLLRQVLLRMVVTDDDGEPVRNRVPRRALLAAPEWETIVEALITARLVSADRDTIQIAHECLTTAWPRLRTWLDEDVEGQRILRHLTASADAWDAMGRPDSELYRGTRLRKTLEWHDTRRASSPNPPDQADQNLTAAERDFLTASTQARDAEARAAEEQARQMVRSRRRTRALLGSGVALLVVALIAGIVAIRQRQQSDTAETAAAAAEAQRVDDVAASSPGYDTAALLAVQANKIQNSPQTRAEVSDLVDGHPSLIRSVTTDDVIEALAVSPDGHTLTTGEEHVTATYDTKRMVRTRISPVNGWTIGYRADAKQLVVVSHSDFGLGLAGHVGSAALTDPTLSSLHPLPTPGVRGAYIYGRDADYSADGRFLTLDVSGSDQFYSVIDHAVLVYDLAHLDHPRIVSRADAFAAELSPDGHFLYVATTQPAVTVIDVRAGRTVTSIALPGALAQAEPPADLKYDNIFWDAFSDILKVSPDGKMLAVAELNEVAVYDTATLTQRYMLHGHHGLVRTIAFSRDGRLLATGSQDHTAMVWDLSTGGAAQTLTGHADTVMAVAFSTDDSTLYTGGLDKRLLVWDLTGRRQLAARVVDGGRMTFVAGTAVPSPNGRTVIDTGLTSTGQTTRFLSIATGRSSPAQDDPGGAPLAAWLPPDYRRAVTAAGPVLKVWDSSTGNLVNKRIIGTGDITAVAAGTDGGSVVVGDRTGGVRRVDTDTMDSGPVVQFDHPAVALAMNGATSAIALLDDKTYATVNLDDGSVVQRRDLGFKPTAAAVSPDGARLAVGGASGEGGLLDLASGDWINPPTRTHRTFVTGASFAPDGRTFVTSAFDGGVQFWDGVNGTPTAGMHVSQNESPAIAVMTPDQHTAVVATADGAVYRVDGRFDQWVAHLCDVVGRDLTKEEWQANFDGQAHRQTCSAG